MEQRYLTDKVVCYNCKHFHQHYGYRKEYNQIFEVHAGHCGFPRVKPRKPTDTCIKWEEK